MITGTINASQMRMINRSAILEFIRVNTPTSRTAISRELEVSMPTAMRVIDGLLDENLVYSVGKEEKGMGRRRDLLAYNKDAFSVIGIDLGGTKLYGALANIGGEIIHEIVMPHHDSTGEQSFDLVVSMIEDLLSHARDDQPVRGISVGAPGVTLPLEGSVEWAPSLNWRNFPLKGRLEERFPLPVFIDNDVNLAVLGENWFGVGANVKNMILISIGTGVGSGLILDGALYRGYSRASGEVGYMVPRTGALGREYSGFGALESIISGSGIADRARDELRRTNGQSEFDNLTAQDVFAAARDDKPWAVSVVNETLDYLSLAIANINTLLDLELIVLSGGVATQSDILLDGIYKRIEGVIPRIPRIEASNLGRRATVMGAIVMVIHATDNYYVVRKLS